MLPNGSNDNVSVQGRTTVAIACPDCGQSGTAIWEMDGTDSTARRVIDVSSGFHLETGRTVSGEVLIVCDSCGAILPG